MSLTADELRKLVTTHLSDLGLELDNRGRLHPHQADKEFVRRLHEPVVNLEIKKSAGWIRSTLPKYRNFFANGNEVDVLRIEPKLVQVTESWHNDLWRLARFTWMLPYSQGFGRRMRYLVLDEYHQKLIGIFALQSPPLSFPARDRLFSYQPGEYKTAVINQTMDIHTLGAVMPYARLLGGKLITMAAVSDEVRGDYREKYEGRITTMAGRTLPSHLIALTTTSAFGRSSIYNRIRFHEQQIAVSLGYTEGYGHFHLEHLYPFLKEYLESQGIETGQGYGTGPRRKWQLMRAALKMIGFEGNLLKHGVLREAFMFPLINNLASYMDGEDTSPQYKVLPFADLSAYWRERWLIPRSIRVDGWHKWDNSHYARQLTAVRV